MTPSIRHQNEPRVQLYVPKEETFPIPLKCIDVTRELLKQIWTCCKRNVKIIIGMWTRIEVQADSWKGCTKYTLLKEKPPKGSMWSGERLTKIRATTRPANVWPEVWSKMGKAAQKREEEWAIEKPKLNNARRLRGICFIDPEDGEYGEKLKNARRKFKVPKMRQCRARKGQRNTSRFRKLMGRVANPTRFPKQSMHESWRSMNQQESVSNRLYRKLIKITSKAKDTIRLVHKFIPTMPAKMITYRFFFEGLITEFGNNYRNRFFPGGLFLNLVIITDRFFPQCAVFESGKKKRKLVAQSLLSIFIHFLNFYCEYSTIQHTYSTHHTQYTTTHSIQAHHLTSHHMAPHYTTLHHITAHHSTWHHSPNSPFCCVKTVEPLLSG